MTHIYDVPLSHTEERKRQTRLRLRRVRCNDQYQHETRYHKPSRNESYQGNATSARGELAAYDPILGLEVTMESDEQD